MTDQPDERPETEEFVFDTEKEIETARKEESRKKTEVYSTISHDDAFEVTVPQEEEVYDAPNAENQPDEPEDLPGDPRFTVEVPAGDDEVYDASSLGRPLAGEYGDDQPPPRQQQYRSWNTDIRNHHLRQVIPMLSSQINECIFISADKDKGKKHRPPNHIEEGSEI